MSGPKTSRREAIACAAFAFAVPSLTTGAFAQAASSDEQELLALQIRYQQAFVDRDAATLRRYRADDWSVVFPDGRQVAREEVERTFSGYRRELAEVQDARVRFVSPDVALIEGAVRERFEVGGRLHDGVFRFTDVMVRQDGWRCVSSHFTLATDLLAQGPNA